MSSGGFTDMVDTYMTRNVEWRCRQSNGVISNVNVFLITHKEANDPLARATKDQRNGSEYCNSKRNVY